MDPVDALRFLGGVADYSSVVRLTSRRALAGAVDGGVIVRSGRGRFALSAVDDALRLAHATNGTLCLVSAAIHLGWAVKEAPALPQVCYPKDRRLAPTARRLVDARWADLAPSDRLGLCTAAGKTLEMCGRTLPYADALAIADSALRAGFEPDLRALRHARGRGAARIRRMVANASADAANPFESVLRAIASEIRGLHLRPQIWVGDLRPDLVDEDLRLVIEADSFEWHGGRAALHRDANRYNALVSAGWTVLRFSWEEVMLHPERVQAVLERVAEQKCGPKSA